MSLNTTSLPLLDGPARRRVRDLQEWIKCVQTCDLCEQSKQISKFSRLPNFSKICFDCVDKEDEITKSQISNRNRTRRLQSKKNMEKLTKSMITNE